MRDCGSFQYLIVAAATLCALVTSCIPSWLDESRFAPESPSREWKPPLPRSKPTVANDRVCPDSITEELDPWDLIDIALKNNPQTQLTWHSARAAAYNVGAAKSTLYPNVIGSETLDATQSFGGGSGGGNFSGGTSGAFGGGGGRGPGHFESVTSDLSLSYLLFDFGGRCGNIAAAYDSLAAANWTHNRLVQTVILNVVTAYYNYQYYLGLMAAATQNVKDAMANLDAAKTQFEMGVATIVDVFQAQSNEMGANLQLVTAQGLASTALGQLATSLGWPADTIFPVADMPQKLQLIDITEDMSLLFDTARNSRPDLWAAYSNYCEARANIAIQTSAALPTLTLFGDASGTKYFGSHSGLNGSTQRASLNLTAPIFSGWLYENEIAAAKELASASYANWKTTELSVLLDVVTAYYAYQTAVQSLTFAEDYLKYSQKAYDAAITNYREGTGSILTVLSTDTTLSDARAQLVQSKTNLMVSIARLSYAVGTM